MKTTQSINPASAYLEGMIWAAFGVRIFGDNASEWQIDAVSKYAKKAERRGDGTLGREGEDDSCE